MLFPQLVGSAACSVQGQSPIEFDVLKRLCQRVEAQTVTHRAIVVHSVDWFESAQVILGNDALQNARLFLFLR